MELYIFDKQLNFKAIIDDINGQIWTTKQNDVGDFKFYLPYTKKIERGDYVSKDKKEDAELGRVSYLQIRNDIERGKMLEVKGELLSKMLDQRITLAEKTETSLDNALTSIINDNFINPTDPARKIDNLDLVPVNVSSETTTIKIEQYKNCLSVIKDLCKSKEVGFKVLTNLTTKRHQLRFYNKTITDKIFSTVFDNVIQETYTESEKYLANVVYALSGEDRVKRLNDHAGMDRIEVYKKFSDIKKEIDGVTYNDNQIDAMLENRAKEYISTKQLIKSFDSLIVGEVQVGEVVTLKNEELGIINEICITEKEESYSEGVYEVNVRFGNGQLTLLERIREMR